VAFSLTRGDAHRYPPQVAPFAALSEHTPAAFDDLRELVAAGRQVALLSIAPLELPDDWDAVGSRWIDQMVCDEPREDVTEPAGLVELGEPDVRELQALTALTNPGPFESRTILLGRYIGVRVDGRVAAMAGERLRPQGHVEISAVCTHPDFAGRGYATALMRLLMADAARSGHRPMLHVKTENGAKRLYEKLGFRVRRPIRLTVIRPR
jgi:predicted GNAT family acetyltransferase